MVKYAEGFVPSKEINSSMQFKLSYKTSHTKHKLLSIGVENRITLTESLQYFKIPIHSRESISISKGAVDGVGNHNPTDVVISVNQDNITPSKGDESTIEVSPFSPAIIEAEVFKKFCPDIDEFSVTANCFAFISVSGDLGEVLTLFIDETASMQHLFSDVPVVV